MFITSFNYYIECTLFTVVKTDTIIKKNIIPSEQFQNVINEKR